MHKLSWLLLVIFFSFTSFAQDYWQIAYSGGSVYTTASPQGNVFTITYPSDSSLVRTTDHGFTWSYSAKTNPNFSTLKSNYQALYGTNINGHTLVKSTDEGSTWTPLTLPYYDSPYSVWPLRNGMVYTETWILAGGYSYVSSNMGNSWTKIGLPESYLQDVVSDGSGITLALFLVNLPGQQPLLYRSTNNGETWLQVNGAPEGINALYSTNNGWFFAFKNERLFRSTDSGLTWHEPAPNRFSFTLHSFVEDANSNLYMSANIHRVVKSTDMGATWYQLDMSGVPEGAYGSLVIDNTGFLYLDTGWGIFRTVDSVLPVELISFTSALDGNNVLLSWSTASETNNKGFIIERKETGAWEKLGFIEGAGTSAGYNHYNYTDNNLSAGKYYYRLRQIDYNGSEQNSKIIEVDIQNINSYSIEQNFPNPFNPSTTIKFSLPKETHVTLKIYSILGQEVKTLINEIKPAGDHTFNFTSGELNSGLYIYKLETAEFSGARKMILVK